MAAIIVSGASVARQRAIMCKVSACQRKIGAVCYLSRSPIFLAGKFDRPNGFPNQRQRL